VCEHAYRRSINNVRSPFFIDILAKFGESLRFLTVHRRLLRNAYRKKQPSIFTHAVSQLNCGITAFA
jgi:hypothetical protein